ncbi:hypothetical protein [Phytohabitans houttuyneae]|uniref:Uncharacterized protein n=1 Tax=Phytohabitans houttuyneae TaxID=1076126 RepID=A0A6V8KI17_9ACTN|nr:hypothetical protein [Phytohabitans houttuyneae]GFJ82111.1 hypothetical protein Phou_062910 [Phytohabitans houttuyneae]
MPDSSSRQRLAQHLTLALHLSVHTVLNILAGARYMSRGDVGRARTRPVHRDLAAMLGYYVRAAVRHRACFPTDTDRRGRPNAHQRPLPRDLVDRRRHLATGLLRALGDSQQAVQSALTRHWSATGHGVPHRLLEHYLAHQLADRGPVGVDAYPWVCDVGGTWVATPRPVRHADAHERRLEAAPSPRPRQRRARIADLAVHRRD